MDNSTDTLQKIPVNVLREILDALSATFQQELGTESQYQGKNVTWAIPEIGLTSGKKESEIRLRNFVTGLSGTSKASWVGVRFPIITFINE